MTVEYTIQNLKEELIKHIAQDDYELFYLYTFEEQRALNLIQEILDLINSQADLSYSLYIYDYAEGLHSKTDKRLALLKRDKLTDPYFVLPWLEQNGAGLVVFLNPRPLFEARPDTVRLFKNTLSRLPELKVRRENFFLKFFIISPSFYIPEELQRDALHIDMPLPTKEEILAYITEFTTSFGIKHLSEGLMNSLVFAFQGLGESDIKNILKYCLYDGKLTEDDIEEIIKFKKQLIKKESLLEFVEPVENLSDVGGLKNLKKWIERKTTIIKNLGEAIEFGVDIPKGILLFGVPGCGKSLIAKVIARHWSYPLLKLDMGMVLGPYVGQSEENIRRAIKIAETVAPCVLWIDEIEKGFAGISSDSGGSSDVIRRVFGTFLTWMQEKKSPVFVVATANDISQMPPEFLRKGRFDEIFFLDFPSKESRKDILKIHLRKRNKEDWFTILEKFADSMEGYTGADIEAVVKELIEMAFLAKIKKRDFNIEESFKAICKDFKPLSETNKKAIEELKKRTKEIGAKYAE
ncbi:AAA family ATPase [Candidatus Woesearchaeota archaeon]|nr:MAG: AAA family ATPase [Candidatus Woesearchaeota archaeon]